MVDLLLTRSIKWSFIFTIINFKLYIWHINKHRWWTNMNMKKNLTFVVATRKGSKRVKNKNIRKFGNSSLLELKLKQIRRVFKQSRIFLSSDCSKSLKIGKKYKAQVDLRPKKFATDNVPMKNVYSYLASKINSKYVCYLHVTSPFLKDATLKNAIKIFFSKKRKTNYTLATVTRVKDIYGIKTKLLITIQTIHDLNHQIPALNFAINIVGKYMQSKGRIVVIIMFQ